MRTKQKTLAKVKPGFIRFTSDVIRIKYDFQV